MAREPFIYNPPLEPRLDILYHDEDIIVVNKPSTILSVPGKKPEHFDSILSRVRELHPSAHAVHRLDYGTSGVLVVGLHTKAVSEMGKQFQNHLTQKRYIAWVSGIVTESGSVDLPLCTDYENRPYQKVDFEQGRPALTEYEPLYTDPEHNRTLLRLLPKTGRSHQLRVHCREIGHPIFGDHLYAPDDVYHAVPHLYLHAYYLKFYHPLTREEMIFTAPAPFPVPLELRQQLLQEGL